MNADTQPRVSTLLPTIRCARCDVNVPISAMGDHRCGHGASPPVATTFAHTHADHLESRTILETNDRLDERALNTKSRRTAQDASNNDQASALHDCKPENAISPKLKFPASAIGIADKSASNGQATRSASSAASTSPLRPKGNIRYQLPPRSRTAPLVSSSSLSPSTSSTSFEDSMALPQDSAFPLFPTARSRAAARSQSNSNSSTPIESSFRPPFTSPSSLHSSPLPLPIVQEDMNSSYFNIQPPDVHSHSQKSQRHVGQLLSRMDSITPGPFNPHAKDYSQSSDGYQSSTSVNRVNSFRSDRNANARSALSQSSSANSHSASHSNTRSNVSSTYTRQPSSTSSISGASWNFDAPAVPDLPDILKAQCGSPGDILEDDAERERERGRERVPTQQSHYSRFRSDCSNGLASMNSLSGALGSAQSFLYREDHGFRADLPNQHQVEDESSFHAHDQYDHPESSFYQTRNPDQNQNSTSFQSAMTMQPLTSIGSHASFRPSRNVGNTRNTMETRNERNKRSTRSQSLTRTSSTSTSQGREIPVTSLNGMQLASSVPHDMKIMDQNLNDSNSNPYDMHTPSNSSSSRRSSTSLSHSGNSGSSRSSPPMHESPMRFAKDPVDPIHSIHPDQNHDQSRLTTSAGKPSLSPSPSPSPSPLLSPPSSQPSINSHDHYHHSQSLAIDDAQTSRDAAHLYPTNNMPPPPRPSLVRGSSLNDSAAHAPRPSQPQKDTQMPWSRNNRPYNLHLNLPLNNSGPSPTSPYDTHDDSPSLLASPDSRSASVLPSPTTPATTVSMTSTSYSSFTPITPSTPFPPIHHDQRSEARHRRYKDKSSTPIDKGPCRGCGLAITGKSVSSADGQLSGRYHKACFVCKTCSHPFVTADFYVLKNHPYCSRHYHEANHSLCQGCDRGIEGQYLELGLDLDAETHTNTDTSSPPWQSRKYHSYCFTCQECHRILRDDYYEWQGRTLCEQHAFRAAQKPSSSLGYHGMTSGSKNFGPTSPSTSQRDIYPSSPRAARPYPERRTTRLMMM